MKKFLIAIFALLAMASCTKEERNNTIINQEESIDRYISSLKDVRIARNGGSNRIVYTEGTGTQILEPGDSVKFYYAGYTFASGKGALFATNIPEIAQEKGFPLAGGIHKCVIGEGNLVSGLDNGLIGAKAGEKCHVVFSAKYGYNNTVVYNVPKLTPLIFEVWIEEIIKN